LEIEIHTAADRRDFLSFCTKTHSACY